MHPEQRDFIADRLRHYDAAIRRVIDFGALDINGNHRGLFPAGVDYVGVDIGPGPGVDVICRCHEYAGTPGDVVLCCEMLEHDQYWQQSLAALPGYTTGLLLITCATTGRREHGTTRNRPESAPHVGDHYRNITAHDVLRYMDVSVFPDWGLSIDSTHHDLFFRGRR